MACNSEHNTVTPRTLEAQRNKSVSETGGASLVSITFCHLTSISSPINWAVEKPQPRSLANEEMEASICPDCSYWYSSLMRVHLRKLEPREAAGRSPSWEVGGLDSGLPAGSLQCCTAWCCGLLLLRERREAEPALWAASPSVPGSRETPHSTAQGRILGMVSDGVTATACRRAAS